MRVVKMQSTIVMPLIWLAIIFLLIVKANKNVMENFPGFKKITEITLQRHWKSGRRILFALNVSNLLFLFLVFICLHNKKDKIYYMAYFGSAKKNLNIDDIRLRIIRKFAFFGMLTFKWLNHSSPGFVWTSICFFRAWQ